MTISDNGKIGDKSIPKTIYEIFKLNTNVSDNQRFNPIRIIKEDIRVLQFPPTQTLFTQYLKLIKPFWLYFAKKFWEYFMNNYVNESSSQAKIGWQSFVKLNSVSTNNSLEAFNKVIKQVQTHFTKLPIEQYLDCLADEIGRRSLQSSEIINFPTSPTIIPEVITFANVLSKRFDDLTLEHDNCYFIKDKTLSLFNV